MDPRPGGGRARGGGRGACVRVGGRRRGLGDDRGDDLDGVGSECGDVGDLDMLPPVRKLALWKEASVLITPQSLKKRGGKKHIMLSYCWSDKDRVLVLYHALTEVGFDMWRDEVGSGVVAGMKQGSTLNMMADAIENACAVLICVSKAYKESPNCRLEGEYAHEIKKYGGELDLVYVMMDSSYTTVSRPERISGWLGLMIGSEIWYKAFNESDINSTVLLLHQLGVQNGYNAMTETSRKVIVDRQRLERSCSGPQTSSERLLLANTSKMNQSYIETSSDSRNSSRKLNTSQSARNMQLHTSDSFFGTSLQVNSNSARASDSSTPVSISPHPRVPIRSLSSKGSFSRFSTSTNDDDCASSTPLASASLSFVHSTQSSLYDSNSYVDVGLRGTISSSATSNEHFDGGASQDSPLALSASAGSMTLMQSNSDMTCLNDCEMATTGNKSTLSSSQSSYRNTSFYSSEKRGHAIGDSNDDVFTSRATRHESQMSSIPSSVIDFLTQFSLLHLSGFFYAQKIDSLDIISELTERDVCDLKVVVGDRVRLRRGISNLKGLGCG